MKLTPEANRSSRKEKGTTYGSNGQGTSLETLTASKQPAWTLMVDWQACRKEVSHGTPLNAWREENIATLKSGDVACVPYVTFWRHFSKRYPKVDLDYHKVHPPEKSCEIDFKGADPELRFFCRETGQWVQCRLFGSVLTFSQMFFADACISMKLIVRQVQRTHETYRQS